MGEYRSTPTPSAHPSRPDRWADPCPEAAMSDAPTPDPIEDDEPAEDEDEDEAEPAS